jgi:hypothetical protein
MARARDERQIKTVDIARGVFIVRYATANDEFLPPHRRGSMAGNAFPRTFGRAAYPVNFPIGTRRRPAAGFCLYL